MTDQEKNKLIAVEVTEIAIGDIPKTYVEFWQLGFGAF